MSPLSLYIHVPFCSRRCPYCSFYHVQISPGLEKRFVNALVEEIKRVLDTIPGGAELSTVYVGGGTPSILAEVSWTKMFKAIEPYLSRNHPVEITCELNPEDVTRDLVEFLKGLGVNRLSIGVQTMDDAAQRMLGRCTSRTNAAAMDLVRNRYDNVSVDVLAGLPGRSTGSLEQTLRALLGWHPAHFSLYCLEPGGDVSGGKADFFEAVDSDRSADDYLLACDVLERDGYRHYEVSNFALPERECRHNLVYWDQGSYIGVGPGAHSCLDGKRFHNPPSLEAYLGRDGQSPYSGPVHDHVDAGGEVAERLMLGLRTSRGVELESLRCPRSEINAILQEGFARIDRGYLRLSDRGYLLLNEIVVRLLREG